MTFSNEWGVCMPPSARGWEVMSPSARRVAHHVETSSCAPYFTTAKGMVFAGRHVFSGADLATQARPPTHPPTQNQNNFPRRKNEIWNREPKMRGPFYIHSLSFCPHIHPPTCPAPRPVGQTASTTLVHAKHTMHHAPPADGFSP